MGDAETGTAGTPLPEGTAEPAEALGPTPAAPAADGATDPEGLTPAADALPSGETDAVPAAPVAGPSPSGPQALTDRTSPTATAAPTTSRLFIEVPP
ncbi:hypothetical protein ACFC1R_26835 [Kitasatospora sp. NPDC056138]|uniref:hypothetical protein n=1 Tax=Kitasatospora sp. NPDC056138 TaxID=3345724 RepID=UPI0035DF494D